MSNDDAMIDPSDEYLQQQLVDAEGGLDASELAAPGEQLDDSQLPPNP